MSFLDFLNKLILGTNVDLRKVVGQVGPAGTVEEKDIQNVINKIIYDKSYGGRHLDIPHYTDYHYEEIEKDDEQKKEGFVYIDTAQEFKALCTDVVVDYFMKTKEDMYRFLKIVIGTFEKALNMYSRQKGIVDTDVFFMCKGGNMLRIVANEFLIALPGSASKPINNFYKEYLKRSDADFGIYINPNLPNFQEIQDELTFLSFILQYMLRDQFLKYPTYYFEYERYNENVKKEILNGLLNKLNAAGSLTDVEQYKNGRNPDYFGGKFTSVCNNGVCVGEDYNYQEENPADKFIEFLDGSKDKSAVFDWPDSKTHYIHCNMNTALEFGRVEAGKTKDLRKFNLTRTKINFGATFVDANGNQKKENFGGELIDVSLVHKLNSHITEIWENKQKNFKRYHLKYGDETISFTAYSIAFLTEDLEEILYEQRSRPWEDKKYKKRLYRSFYFYFLDLFEKMQSNSERREIIQDLQKILTLIKDGNEDVVKNIEELDMKVKKYNLLLTTFLKNLRRLYLTKGSDSDKFDQFLQFSLENCEMLIKGFKFAEDYCTIGGKISEKTIYTQGDLASLVGGGNKEEEKDNEKDNDNTKKNSIRKSIKRRSNKKSSREKSIIRSSEKSRSKDKKERSRK